MTEMNGEDSNQSRYRSRSNHSPPSRSSHYRTERFNRPQNNRYNGDRGRPSNNWGGNGENGNNSYRNGNGYNNNNDRNGYNNNNDRNGYNNNNDRNGYNNNNNDRNGYNNNNNNNNRGNSNWTPLPQENGQLIPIDFSKIPIADFEKEFYLESEITKNRQPEELNEFRVKNQLSITKTATCQMEVNKPIMTFEEMNLQKDLMEVFEKAKYERPTCIQSVAWPLLMNGSNVVGIAQTGSGKTMAFLLPAVRHLQGNERTSTKNRPRCLVLAPTRELAQQIHQVAKLFSESKRIRTACCYGGAPRREQLETFRFGVDILIATPGRLIDFITTRRIIIDEVTYLVLDEADRMLDMGFEPQIKQILGQMRPTRQTMMFSATWPKEVVSLATNYIQDYIHITIGGLELTANHDIEQKVILLLEHEKEERLQQILKTITEKEKQKTIIFCERKVKVDELARNIRSWGYKAIGIHGDKSQDVREGMLNKFKRATDSIALVATDVASRGLDIDDISFVINYDFPNDTEDYIHRIGRTGRAGNRGIAYTFFTQDNARHIRNLINVMKEANQIIPEELYSIRQPMSGKNYSRYSRGGTFRKRTNQNFGMGGGGRRY
ncbi:hypothetical protein SNEBB_003623 [Seison nebaliae]|nr:hypothetical protein SNEBB_003623 [Seison nebaliae]